MENSVAFLARFPMPAVVLSALLGVGHLVLRISDDLRPPLFLQPASTIIRPQQVVTAGLFEDSAPNLLVVVLALLYSAKALQPEWGDRECMRFVMLVNVLHLSASWLCMVLLYVLFREEHYLFARLGGCAGLLGALSVAIKQQVAHGKLPTEAQPAWLAAVLPHVVLVQLCWGLAVLALLRAGPPDELLLAINGTVAAWVYLRFYQVRHGRLRRRGWGRGWGWGEGVGVGECEAGGRGWGLALATHSLLPRSDRTLPPATLCRCPCAATTGRRCGRLLERLLLRRPLPRRVPHPSSQARAHTSSEARAPPLFWPGKRADPKPGPYLSQVQCSRRSASWAACASAS